jgi:hypothetical protein
MASLVYVFSDLYGAVAKYLGTYGSAGPTGSNLTDAKAVVNDAYARFLSADGGYRWSFLDENGVLVTMAGDYIYQLPDTFESLCHPFQFDQATGYGGPQGRPLDYILSLRADGTAETGWPELYSIQAGKYDPKFGQKREVVFYPTPDAAYTLLYRYRFMPPKLENDTDVPIGGPELAGLLKQFCLAECESQKDKASGVQEAKLATMLAMAIARDSANKPHTIGHNSDGNTGSYWSEVRSSWRVNNIYPDTD